MTDSGKEGRFPCEGPALLRDGYIFLEAWSRVLNETPLWVALSETKSILKQRGFWGVNATKFMVNGCHR